MDNVTKEKSKTKFRQEKLKQYQTAGQKKAGSTLRISQLPQNY
jgi:hypothetical protein